MTFAECLIHTSASPRGADIATTTTMRLKRLSANSAIPNAGARLAYSHQLCARVTNQIIRVQQHPWFSRDMVHRLRQNHIEYRGGCTNRVLSDLQHTLPAG